MRDRADRTKGDVEVDMTLSKRIVRQFQRPEGALGRLAGWVMATRPSNRRRNAWTVDLLDIQARDRILEVGCGPGLALRVCAERAREGFVLGLDHSLAMLAQAARRNRRTIRQGIVELRLGGIEELRNLDRAFDKLFSVNVIQFVPDKQAVFRIFHDLTAPHGIVATTYQPRHRHPTRADAMRMAAEIEGHMRAAGFEGVGVQELPLHPVPAVCVLGRKPQSGREAR